MAIKPDPAPKKPKVTKVTPPPKKTFDPYKALGGMTPTQVALLAAAEARKGPDYSKVPTVDFGKLQSAAWKTAGAQIQPAIAPLQQARDQLPATAARNAQIASNFAAAFASIAGGGNANIDDPAAQKYALENYGGSYVGGMAAALGARIIGQQGAALTEQDGKYAAQIADIMAKRPDIADKIYDDVAKAATDLVKRGRDAAELDYTNRVKALGAYGRALLDSQKIDQAQQRIGISQANLGLAQQRLANGGSSGGGGGGNSGLAGSAGKPTSFSAASSYATSMSNATGTIWKVRKKGNGYEPYDTLKSRADSPTAATGGDSQAKLTGAYSVLKGLTANGRAKAIIDWKDTAANTAEANFYGTDKADPKTYQQSLAQLLNHGIPLDIAQNALNKYWRKPGDETNSSKPGEGRPVKSFQQRQKKSSGKATNTANTLNTSASVIQFAAQQLGLPYVFGSESPGKSFDCSGLIHAAYKAAGINIGRDTYHQIKDGRRVDPSTIQPGDLVFPTNHHVVMYVGNGQVIAAPHTGTVVQLQPLSAFGPNIQVRRVLPNAPMVSA